MWQAEKTPCPRRSCTPFRMSPPRALRTIPLRASAVQHSHHSSPPQLCGGHCQGKAIRECSAIREAEAARAGCKGTDDEDGDGGGRDRGYLRQGMHQHRGGSSPWRLLRGALVL
ncbi:hypothetical protein GOP47_0005129 [Adiantum capillus-veneris]|uniref:Uncharacterized protein n=1 Tax=Adiantum capillus-veneris TaxID=13818 RepID=A0A9D4V4J0_ADICA|nr:hypothetical protein GOP47_0005129 [Adiantum capillus-veneris]